MSDECVIAMYDTVAQASDAVLALKESGFPSDRVALATKTLKAEKEVREAIEFGDEMEKDAAIGAGAGVLIGLLSAAVVSSITGVGVFLMAGPIIAAGIAGGLFGATAGWGVHKDHIARYEEKLKEGKVLVIAHGEPLTVAAAEQVLQETGPIALRLHAESSADSPDIENC